jgi:very-short-patch-repair endonuclease
MPYDPTLPRDTARQLRANATEAEQKLWSGLRKKQLYGFQFRRPYSIGLFFADFVCLEANLVIEVDVLSTQTRKTKTNAAARSCAPMDFACCDSGTPT